MRGDESEPYQGTVPSTTLKLADIHLTCIGQLEPDTDCTFVRFEDHDRGIYRKLILRENQIVGSILLGDRSNVVPVTKLIKGHTDVSRYMERLSEGDLDFRELVASTKKPEPPRYECTICGYIYDPKQGDPEGDVPPDTPFEALPQDWSCPLCGAERDMFVKIAD
jgi:rubredoxin